MTSPLIISIAGAHSGSGKTTFAEELIKRLEGNWGAIKYTKTAFYTTITDSPEIIIQQNKDTARLKNAGAKRVLWVQSPAEELKETIAIAIGNLSGLDGIIVEGNSPIEFLESDIIIFIFGRNTSRIKESAEKAIKKSSMVVYQEKPVLPLSDKKACFVSLQGKFKGIDECMEIVMGELKHKKVEKRLIESSKEGRISCAIARTIAEDLNVAYKDVGEAANNLKIKIKNCDLGCF